MTSVSGAPARKAVGVLDIPSALLAPRRFFARVEDVPAYAWSLVVLLTTVTLTGYATVQTGLIDREVQRRVNDRTALIDQQKRDIVERSELRELYEEQRKQGEFELLLTRMQVVAAEPLRMLAAILIIAAVLYGAVALTGRKPEWHTLMSICVFASYAEALRLLMRLVLMISFGTLDIATSPTPLLKLWPEVQSLDPRAIAAIGGGLTALDPFRLWFWIIVLVGLAVTCQLRGWKAWMTCGLCWLVATASRTALAVAPLMQPASGGM